MLIIRILIALAPAILFGQETFVVNIDLGGQDTEWPWNTISNSQTGKLNALSAMNGQSTAIGIEVYDAFNGTNSNGTLEASTSLELPAFVSGDSFFGNQKEWSGVVQKTAGIKLTGLEPDKSYDLSLFASRLASDNRETAYTILSSNVDTTLYLNVSNNVAELVELTGLFALNDGSISISATTGPNNDNEYGFYYLGAIRIQYEDVVQVVTPELTLTDPQGGEYWQHKERPEIRWNSQGIDELTLEYSTDNGDSWNFITTTGAQQQKYVWEIPDLSSSACLVRLSSDSLVDRTKEAFEITNSDTNNCHIVVLGSSTAAGTGPSSIDSAWVWMYEDILYQNDTRFRLTNIARGGFTTYNILPTGSIVPKSISHEIDTLRNITRALALDPQAIIINLPSNDAARMYSVEDQLKNYDLILAELEQRELPYWICTPQPRNNFSDEQKDIQLALRDSTFARFENFAIDFWTGLADHESDVDPAYDSGDGIHLNNAGHRILLERVLVKNINSYLLDKKVSDLNTFEGEHMERLIVFPSPTELSLSINNVLPPFDLEIYGLDGRLLYQKYDYEEILVSLPESGIQFIKVVKSDKTFGAWVIRN